MGKYTTILVTRIIVISYFISDINIRFLVDLDGGVDVAGVDLTIVGLLAVVAAELCTQAAIPATAPLVVLPEVRLATCRYSKLSLQRIELVILNFSYQHNMHAHIKLLLSYIQ